MLYFKNLVPPKNLSMKITPGVIFEDRNITVTCTSTTTNATTFTYGKIFLPIKYYLCVLGLMCHNALEKNA